MLDGWRNQMLSRNLAFSTIATRQRMVEKFHESTNEYPWTWSAAMMDEWLGDNRAIHGHARSTIRAQSQCLRMFCDYLVDPAYGWQERCQKRFGSFPIQIVHEWNAATHVQEAGTEKSVRPFTPAELQDFFDCADQMAIRRRAQGRKGWAQGFRDATLFKTAYAWGLRRNETRLLETTDFGRNPAAPEFGARGVLRVRFGKAMKGSPPKPRSVLTVFGWSVECLDEWIHEVRPALAEVGSRELWPTERGGAVSNSRLGHHFREVRREVELPDSLTFHSFRRSYVTHLIEDGFDARFVQEQVGHEYASTTAIYTSVSSDYRTRSLRNSLDGLAEGILNIGANKEQP